MTRGPAWILLALGLIGTAYAAGTQRVPFPEGGTIRLENSTGYLTVEGWDEPEVEITMASPLAACVIAEHHSNEELTISNTLPARKRLLILPRATDADCTVRVPRNSHLIIHHADGYVMVSNVAGDIEVHSHSGDVIVALPDPGPYSIDARAKVGNVTSDFTGDVHSRFLLGTYLANTSEAPSRRIYLRMGRGSIAVKKDPSAHP